MTNEENNTYMKRYLTFAGLLAIAATIALAACSGGDANQQTAASANPSNAPVAQATDTPDPAHAISVKLLTASPIGTPEPDGSVPVRVKYRVTVQAPTGISAAYGTAELPFARSCNGDGTVSIALGPLIAGAMVEQTADVLCSAGDAKNLTGDTANFYTMNFTPSIVKPAQ